MPEPKKRASIPPEPQEPTDSEKWLDEPLTVEEANAVVEAAESEAPKKWAGTGWLPDKHDARDEEWASRKLFGAPRGLPSSAIGLQAFVRHVRDQSTTNSCVGQALAAAIDTRLRFLKIEMPEPSALGLYANGRPRPLQDIGCYPRDLMKAARDIGVPREDSWPFIARNVDADPPWDVEQDASRFLLFRWWRITSSGLSRSDEIAAALAKNYPVIFGLDLDAAFFNHGPKSGTITSLGAPVGGHMLCILGYRSRDDGAREFLVLNSWGESWGEFGFAWIHEDVVCSDRASDHYAIEVSP